MEVESFEEQKIKEEQTAVSEKKEEEEMTGSEKKEKRMKLITGKEASETSGQCFLSFFFFLARPSTASSHILYARKSHHRRLSLVQNRL